MAKKGTSTKAKGDPTNGKTANNKAAKKPESSTHQHVMGVGIALLAFAVGILFPPILSHFQGSSSIGTSRRSTLQQSSSSSTSTAQHSISFSTRQRLPKFPCTEERLAEYLHEEAVTGFHIVCLEYDAQNRTAHLNVYVGGTRTHSVQHELTGSAVTWDALKEALEETAGVSSLSRPEFQPWALFSPEGERLFDARSVEGPSYNTNIVETLAKDYGMALLYSGGQFLWPGVRLGFKRQVALYSIMPGHSQKTFEKNQTATLETLSLIPLVLSVEGFLSKEECRHIQEVAAPSLEYSGVVLMDKDKGRPASDFRTSQTTFLGPVDDVFVDIDYRTASLTRVPRTHQEHVQVLRYGVGEHYDSHHDYFDPQFYQSDKNTLKLIRNGNRNRLATVFWYLSDVSDGGETVFPRFNRGQERSFRDCETGLLVKPQEGKVIIFYSLTADGKMDPYSLHGACPPKEGIKWAANKWIWNEHMGYTPP